MKKLLIALLLFAKICPAQVNLTLGLRAYYPFTGNANDASGNGNNPVFNNATLTTDRLGNPNSAYHFNGVDNYMKVLNSPTLNMSTKMSMCAWVRPTGFYAGTCHGNAIINKGDADYLPGNYVLRYDDNAGTNGNNCSGPVNNAVENFYGNDVIMPPPGYTPYIQQGQWYSVIVTLDGTTAKLYINCQLKFSAPQSTTTLTNSYDVFFGRLNSASFPYWVNGDLDEIRIYDRALNVDEVNVLGGCPSTGTPVGGIINSYTPVQAFSPCDNRITVENASAFNTGDTVLMIQMKGAVIDSGNTATFGSVTDYKNSGNYEFNYVKSKAGNVIELKNKLTRQYDIPAGKVQLIRVPYYNSASVTTTLTCLPWDGSKGGVLVLNVRDTITMLNNIDVNGKGFHGAAGYNPQNQTLTCFENNYNYPINTIFASQKGESITTISNNILCGKGNPAGGGGGGLGHNSGGGGGGNGGSGGFGGYQLDACGGAPFDNRGIGGRQLAYSNAANRIFLGSGGGAGHEDNIGTPPSNGGNGAGIIIIIADKIQSNSNKILATGDDGTPCVVSGSSNCHDGMGGGGAGGTVLLSINQFIDNAVIENKGGKGADETGDVIAGGKIGAGGGGGGGLAFLKTSSLPSNLTITNTGGANGVLTQGGNNAWGATAGSSGINLFNLIVPVDNNPFTKNIDSVRIKDSATSCKTFDFKGLGYTNTNPISLWQWYFGDGGTANTQNTTHTYPAVGTYLVKLVITDINGCRDSIQKNVTTVPFTADAGNDTTLCSAPSVSIVLHASAGTAWSWTPAAFLNNPALQNPTATIPATTLFFVTVTNALGCTARDSILVSLANSITPSITISTPNNNICSGNTAVFKAIAINGGSPPSFQWKKNGINAGTNSNTYTDAGLVNGDIITCVLTSNISCASPASATSNAITMNISDAPANIRYPTLTALANQQLQLQARNLGGNNYLWLPSAGLSNNLIINPVFNFAQSQEYTIRINTPAGCPVVDTQLVVINGRKGIYVPKAFSPNGDGTNDRLYPILVGISKLNYFRIYNRWGNLIFETNSGNPALGWDGTFKGSRQPVETYTWTVEGIDIDGITIKKSGGTLLIR